MIFLVLSTLFLLVCNVQSYCVYNKLTDNTVVEIVQKRGGIPAYKLFNKHIESNADACCPYWVSDCSARNDSSDFADFQVYFRWPRYTSERHLVHCFAGGGLAFYGSETNHYAECTDPAGSVTRVSIIPDAIRS